MHSARPMHDDVEMKMLLFAILISGCAVPAASQPSPTIALSTTVRATATPRPSPTPALAEIRGGSIQLLTPSIGWVFSSAGLERTDDGGATWRVVNAAETFGALRFVDAQRGWATLLAAPLGRAAHEGCAQPPSGPCEVLATTSDGGRTWTDRIVVPAPLGISPFVIQAIDSRVAWAIVSNAKCAPDGCIAELRKTTDGGATWTTQRSGDMQGLRMADAQHGWLTISRAPANGADVLATTDGGATWTKVFTTNITVVSIDAANTNDAWLLTRDGAFCTASNCSSYELFATHDSGHTWSSLGNPKDFACSGGHLVGPLFASPSIGWFGLTLGAGGGAGTGGVMRTDDGGRNWTCMTMPTNVGLVNAADPLNVWVRSDRREDATSALYATADGGRVWRQIR